MTVQNEGFFNYYFVFMSVVHVCASRAKYCNNFCPRFAFLDICFILDTSFPYLQAFCEVQQEITIYQSKKLLPHPFFFPFLLANWPPIKEALLEGC